jgi:PilZ domain
MPATQHALANQVLEIERRKADRATVALDTLMCDREGRTFGTKILNLSCSGMMALTETPLCERDPVRVDLPTIGWLRADIVWVLGDRVGARFRQPIDPFELEMFERVFG